MKKAFCLLLLGLLSQAVFAQPVITSADLLSVGDIVITQPVVSTTFNPGAAGANQTWDFSALVADGTADTTFYISPAGTPYAANYPSSNIVAFFEGNAYSYYQTAGGKLFYYGETDPTTTLVLTDPATYFISPATYGTYLLDTIAGSISSGPLSGSVSGQVFFEGDGYGTLLLPTGPLTDVLRIKTTTVALATVPFLGTLTDSVFNYSWYKLGYKSPVLEMIEDTQWANGMVVDQTRYFNYYLSLTTGTKAPVTAPSIRVFPNPADDWVRVEGLEKPGRLVVRNTMGRLMMDKAIDPQEQVQVSGWGAGVYMCSVYAEDGSVRSIRLLVR